MIEAKDNNHSVGAGMQQALEYAEILDVPFLPVVPRAVHGALRSSQRSAVRSLKVSTFWSKAMCSLHAATSATRAVCASGPQARPSRNALPRMSRKGAGSGRHLPRWMTPSGADQHLQRHAQRGLVNAIVLTLDQGGGDLPDFFGPVITGE